MKHPCSSLCLEGSTRAGQLPNVASRQLASFSQGLFCVAALRFLGGSLYGGSATDCSINDAMMQERVPIQ